MSKELWKDQEAYDVVFNHFNNCTCQDGKFIVRSALDHIYKALKLNEPMKPNGFKMDWGCPKCDATLEHQFPRCPYCAQAIDWSDEK